MPKVTGVIETQERLRKLQEKVRIESARAMEFVAFKIANDAKRNAPVLTGFLRSNIEFSVKTKNRNIIGLIKAKANYSAVQEFGSRSRGIFPKFYMTRAIQMNKDLVREKLGEHINIAINKVAV